MTRTTATQRRPWMSARLPFDRGAPPVDGDSGCLRNVTGGGGGAVRAACIAHPLGTRPGLTPLRRVCGRARLVVGAQVLPPSGKRPARGGELRCGFARPTDRVGR